MKGHGVVCIIIKQYELSVKIRYSLGQIFHVGLKFQNCIAITRGNVAPCNSSGIL